jgi:prophage regulatory protein
MNVDRIIRDPETKHITGLGKSLRVRLEKKGLFPARRKLSADGRAKGNLYSELMEWVADQPCREPDRRHQRKGFPVSLSAQKED